MTDFIKDRFYKRLLRKTPPGKQRGTEKRYW